MLNHRTLFHCIACLAMPFAALTAEELAIPNALVKLAEFVEATAREAGPLVEIPVAEGDEVQVGTVLAALDDSEQQLLCERAKLASDIARRESEHRVSIESAERSLKLAEEELHRARESVKKFPDTISQQELDRMENVVEQAKLAVTKAKQDHAIAELNAQLKLAEHRLTQANLTKRKIISPIAGRVVRIDVQRGEWVETGRKLIRVVNLDQLRIEAVIDSTQAERLTRNAAIEFRPADSDKTFRGKLTFVSPEVDPFTKKVRVLAVVENPKHLLQPGVKGMLVLLDDESKRAAR